MSETVDHTPPLSHINVGCQLTLVNLYVNGQKIGRILLANPDFSSHRLIRKVEKVLGKMPMLDGRCKGRLCLGQRSNERVFPTIHYRNNFCSKK
jgi:hypothetical protein